MANYKIINADPINRKVFLTIDSTPLKGVPMEVLIPEFLPDPVKEQVAMLDENGNQVLETRIRTVDEHGIELIREFTVADRDPYIQSQVNQTYEALKAQIKEEEKVEALVDPLFIFN